MCHKGGITQKGIINPKMTLTRIDSVKKSL